MKNYIQKWKSLNKNGLKLSLICGLNWLIRFIANSQFYLYSAVFLGFLTYYMSHELQFFTLRILELIIALTMAVGLINMALSREAKKVKHAILMGVMYLFFLAGNSYIKEHALTEFMVNRLLSFWIISLVFAAREIITAIRFRLQPFEKENERTFIDDDTIYYPIFTVHPFGNVEGKSDFYHTLMKFKLSRKAAFTKNGDGLLKRDF